MVVPIYIHFLWCNGIRNFVVRKKALKSGAQFKKVVHRCTKKEIESGAQFEKVGHRCIENEKKVVHPFNKSCTGA